MRFVTACGTRRLTLIAVASAALGFASLAQAAKTELLVYSALEADQIKAYKVGFEKAHPEIELKFVRDSTGIITARLLAEKPTPGRCDLGCGRHLADAAGQARHAGPYAPRNLTKVRSTMRDPAATPTWVGMDLWSSAVCFNTVEAQKRKLPAIASWADLTRPEFKGSITMPHPASSGTGYLMVAAWLQMMGEDKGWAYMDALHQNIGVYTHSGSKPCRQAGAGEFPVGLSFEYRANKTKKDGAPIDIVFPKEGLGWDVEATAIMKTSKKQEAAKVLADWAVTPDANKLYAANFAILALPEAQEKHEFIPADLEKRLAKNDFGWAAANRDRILTEWARRYESKAEKVITPEGLQSLP